MHAYKTIFLDSQQVTQGKGIFKTTTFEVNGDDLARTIQATIEEQLLLGFELHSITPIISSKLYMSAYVCPYTEGVVLIFKK